jgi:ribosomal protein L37AE/L43A
MRLNLFSRKRTEPTELLRRINDVLESHHMHPLGVNVDATGKHTTYQFGIPEKPETISRRMEADEALKYLNGYIDGAMSAHILSKHMCKLCGQHWGVYRHSNDWWMCWKCQPHLTISLLAEYESGKLSIEELAERIKKAKYGKPTD